MTIRKIVTPDSTNIKMKIPAENIGRHIEFIIRPIEETSKSIMGGFLGILSDKSADELRTHIKETRDEWERDI